MYIKNRASGQITVFLSLTLAVVLGLIGTALQTARLVGTRAVMQMRTEAALESYFAEYCRELAETYGVLYRYDSLERQNTVFLNYLERSNNPEQSAVWHGGWQFPFQVEEATIFDEVKMPDSGGAVFVDQALRYLKYANVGAFAVSVLEQLELLGLGLEAEADGADWKSTFTDTDWSKSDNGEDSGYSNELVKESLLDTGLGALEKFVGNGMWNLVKPEGAVLSARTIRQDGLPSVVFRSALPESAPGIEFLSQPVRGLLFNEFLLEKTNCFTGQKNEDGLCYEVEYILAGREREDENLFAVISRLAGIRQGMNLLYLLQDGEKMAQAEAVAALAMGWTGNTALVTVTKYLVAVGWAYAEALSDVHQLLSGGKVPLVKSREDWRFALENLAELGREDLLGDIADEGLNYQDYLRILLALADGQNRCYRMMDIIQLRMQLLDQNFSVISCVGGAACRVRGKNGSGMAVKLVFTDQFSYLGR